jgi:hypothetical protein
MTIVAAPVYCEELEFVFLPALARIDPIRTVVTSP